MAWTTTPWTVTGHTGLAVSPKMTYRVVENPVVPDQLLLFGDDLENPVPCEIDTDGKRSRIDLRELPVVARFAGDALSGIRYDRPFRTVPDRNPETTRFDPLPSDDHGWCVFTAEYVTAAEGTGLVHTAPAFGEDDYRAGVEHGLPFILTVDREGRIQQRSGIEAFAGLWVKEADKPIQRHLRQEGWLLHIDRYRHNYPFCWRCDQPLLYYASLSWFIKTTSRKNDLLRRLMMYKLRADVSIADVSGDFSVWTVLGGDEGDNDPRHPALGRRLILARDETPAGESGSLKDYENHLAKLGIPNASHDLEVDKRPILEANLEELNGVDFTKGCYVGQEVTARMKHRNAVRKRLFPLTFTGQSPEIGSTIQAGDKKAGTIISLHGDIAFGMVKLDYVKSDLSCGDTALDLSVPDYLTGIID